MKKLLLNGCSFAQFWDLSEKFVQDLGCDNYVNLGKAGTSFQRTCRTTVEWIAQNGKPHFVLIPITFCHRWEMPIGDGEKLHHLDGNWIPIQTTMAMREATCEEIEIKNNHDKINRLSDLYYGLIDNTIGYWDKLFTEILLLSSFLDHNNISYLMWDMCNDFDEDLLIGSPHLSKSQVIKHNQKIINLFSFCGNKYMWRAKGMPVHEHFNQHHEAKEYKALEQFLIGYAEQQELFQ